jgi:hypothetical protein
LVPVRRRSIELSIRPAGRDRCRIAAQFRLFLADTPDSNRIELHEIGLRRRPRELAPSKTADLPSQPVVITVKLLVDDDQPLQRTIWEQDLRERIADCSKTLEQHCFARLEVVAVESWETNDSVNELMSH